jgi:hypothetical protein
VFQNFPVVPSRLVIRLLGEDLDDVHDGEKQCLGLFVIVAANFTPLKNGQVFFHSAGLNFLFTILSPTGLFQQLLKPA